jgi:hypothetical protein
LFSGLLVSSGVDAGGVRTGSGVVVVVVGVGDAVVVGVEVDVLDVSN